MENKMIHKNEMSNSKTKYKSVTKINVDVVSKENKIQDEPFLYNHITISDTNDTSDISDISDTNVFTLDTDINNYKQNFDISQEIRYKYGEINTPFFLITKMLDLIEPFEFKNPYKKWLDIGTGTGYFSIILYKKLFEGLKETIPNNVERKTHIIQNMLYMSEIRTENCKEIERLFGQNCNLFKGDFLSLNLEDTYKIPLTFDFVIGNPPYNNNGLKKVPTNKTINKKEDGNTIWCDFIKKSVGLLKEKGEMIVIIPSIWLKPDKIKMYDFMLNYKIEKLNCMNNTETNKIFNRYA